MYIYIYGTCKWIAPFCCELWTTSNISSEVNQLGFIEERQFLYIDRITLLEPWKGLVLHGNKSTNVCNFVYKEDRYTRQFMRVEKSTNSFDRSSMEKFRERELSGEYREFLDKVYWDIVHFHSGLFCKLRQIYRKLRKEVQVMEEELHWKDYRNNDL